MAPLVRTEVSEVSIGTGKTKKNFNFIKDSFKLVQVGMLADTRFLFNIQQFSTVEKDFINDETIELLGPYIELRDVFNPTVAKSASNAAEGIFLLDE
jgi:dynein heavy chain